MKDQKHIIGTSTTTAYDATDNFLDTVNCSAELAVQFSSTPHEWQCINDDFTRKSSHHIM